jgi:hypothetical protein
MIEELRACHPSISRDALPEVSIEQLSVAGGRLLAQPSADDSRRRRAGVSPSVEEQFGHVVSSLVNRVTTIGLRECFEAASDFYPGK